MDSSKAVSTSSSSRSVELTITDQLKTNSHHSKSAHKSGSKAHSSGVDKVDVGMNEVYKSLTILADKVVAKLNELLKDDVPGGIASLNPEDHTPEATAQRIVDGSTALFSVYAKQHPGVQGEELISGFMETIRGGIKSGYNDAAAALGDIGAFDIDGVQSGIEETMSLVEEKLKAFEDDYRKKNGLTTDTTTEQPASSESGGTTATSQDVVA
jgi:hypothetical protein